MNQQRTPPGIPTGGQYSASVHDEATGTLTALDPPSVGADHDTIDAGVTQTRPGVWVVNGTSDYRPRTPEDVERLHELGRGYAEMNGPDNLAEATRNIAYNRLQMTCMVQTANGEMVIMRGQSNADTGTSILTLEDGTQVDLEDGQQRMLDVFTGDIDTGVFTRELTRYREDSE